MKKLHKAKKSHRWVLVGGLAALAIGAVAAWRAAHPAYAWHDCDCEDCDCDEPELPEHMSPTHCCCDHEEDEII